jgi:hypothetical protein
MRALGKPVAAVAVPAKGTFWVKALSVPLALTVVFCFGLANTALATPMGTLNIANCSGGGVTVSSTAITWSPAGTLPGTGCVDTGAGTNVAFTGGPLLPGVAGNIKNLVTGGPSPVDQFMTFPAVSPLLDFMLVALGPGVANTNCTGLAMGGTCSVSAGSPFVLTNLGNNVTAIGLHANGTVSDATGSSNWFGAFTTQLNLDAATIQTEINRGDSIASTHSAQFTVSSVPEPGTLSMLMLGAGLLGVGLKRRKA